MALRVRRPVIQKSALLICDIQDKFRSLIFNMESVIHKSELLNKSCHALGVETIITEQYPAALGVTVPEITRFPTTKVFAKTKFSMLTDEMCAALPERCNQVILCGLESHVCVMQTALDLIEREYDVFLVTDAASSQRPYDRSIALRRMEQAGVVLTTTESILYDLMRDSKHPNFRTVAGFVKDHKPIDEQLPKFDV